MEPGVKVVGGKWTMEAAVGNCAMGMCERSGVLDGGAAPSWRSWLTAALSERDGEWSVANCRTGSGAAVELVGGGEVAA